jgi:EAL domain-containing protein (putative c-di-GMP-specific phosphodiesterase class I)
MTSFRSQFIFSASGMEIIGIEVLAANPSRLRLDDPVAMLEHDLAALRHGGELARRTGLRVQCNVEPSSVVTGLGRVLKAVSAGIVIELVERYTFDDQRVFDSLVDGARRLRKAGALLALDDVTPNPMEIELIRAIRPDIIKVENRAALSSVLKVATTRHLIAERVETKAHAELACAMGVRELQGFWCDRQYQPIPEALPTAIAVTPC